MSVQIGKAYSYRLTLCSYYLNAPGIAEDKACSWGSKDNASGNWAPYTISVARNEGSRLFLSTGWNPVYLEAETPFRDQKPNFGFRIECPEGGCDNSECGVDPAVQSVNQMSGITAVGAGGDSGKGPSSTYCTTSIKEGSPVNIMVFSK